MLFTNARVLFVKHEKRDALVVLAPLSLFLVILQILAWGIDVFNIYALLLSVLVLLSNFHAMFRYSERVYVDHYSVLMKMWAFFTNTFSILGIVATIFFMPSFSLNKKTSVAEKKIYYQGSFRTGFTEASHFTKHTFTLNEYKIIKNVEETDSTLEESNEDVENKLVILMADKRGGTEHYLPYIKKLAEHGYTVYSPDFFTDDCRWVRSTSDNPLARRFVMVVKCLSNPQEFNSQRELYTYNTSVELNGLIPLLEERYGTTNKFFLIGDGMTETAINDYFKLHPEKVQGIFELSTVPEYKTPGYGCITQTDLLLAFALKEKRDYGTKEKLSSVDYMVKKSVEAIENAYKGEE
ncbi:MAG: hypothetical protein MJ188_00165 [Treponema sp.]|nr:hypothetical protein [Treponema sp.]